MPNNIFFFPLKLDIVASYGEVFWEEIGVSFDWVLIGAAYLPKDDGLAELEEAVVDEL